MYCLRLFVVLLHELHYLLHCLLLLFIEKYVCTKFHLNWLLDMAIYVPIVMYGLRLFNVVLQELHCLLQCLS